MNTPHDVLADSPQKSDLQTAPRTPQTRPDQAYRRILVGTDFSPAADSAFEQALTLAKQSNAELLIAHSDVMPGCVAFMPPECFDEWELHSRTEAEANLRALMQRAHQEGVKAHKLLLKGLADDAILAAAGRLGVDLIVIGARRHQGISRFFLGGVTGRLVSRAPCAVLTAHPSVEPP
jgi:nucleotide-binding universal stress UspA family protein